MIVYMLECHSPKSSHPLPLPLSPKVRYTHLCPFSCLAYRVVIFLKRKNGLTFYPSFRLEYHVAVQSLGRVRLLVTPWTAARQASLSFTISRSLPEFMSIESVMPSNHLILCCPLSLLSSVFPSIRVFSSEMAVHIR